MNLSVIALDYDGTIARHDVLDPTVRDAIAYARTKGIKVLLVTGRILEDLRRVAGDLHFVDGIVAENGAVLYFPDIERTSELAPAIPPAFAAELGRRAIPFGLGRCLIDTAAHEAPRLLEAIRTLELPLVLIFNSGRVMTLPQGVSKATGLRAALQTLRLSPRNTLSIGDAENDHELLRLAEVGVAVSWASPALRAAADIVLPGADPASVASYVRSLASDGRMPVPGRVRRHLLLGHTPEGHEFSLGVRGRNVLVAGDMKSGKSWVAGLLCEQLILLGYCVCVIDPEGDYASLEALPGVTILGREDPPPTPRDLLRALRYPDRSVVVDLSREPHDAKMNYIRALLPALNILRQRTGLPHRILLDEAHYYLHDADAPQLLDLDRHGYTVVTYCASRLPAALLDTTEVMIVTCESEPSELDALYRRCAGCKGQDREQWSLLSRLPIGQAAALPLTEEAGGVLQTFTLAPRLTPHVRHRQKYADVPVSSDRHFVFRSHDGLIEQRARTLRELVDAVEQLPSGVLTEYLVRGDFSRWIRDVFGDHALADEVRQLEERHRTSPSADTVLDITNAVRGRYDLT